VRQRVMSGLLRLVCLAALVMGVSLAVCAYEIRDYGADISIEKDSSFTVRESILVDFGQESRHGIFRDLLVRNGERAGTHRSLRVKVLGVTDGAGNPRQFTLKNDGPYLHIRIGDPDSLVTGMQSYAITYAVRNGMLYFPDHDEFYWNVTGTEWDAPIDKAWCRLRFPESISSGSRVQVVAYQGAYGAAERACAKRTSGGGAEFWTARPLAYKEGLTVAASLPPATVTPPSSIQKSLWFVQDNAFLWLPLLYLLGFVWLWRVAGRDPGVGASVMVRYEPPDKLRPGEVGTLIDESVDMIDITSTIIDLAVRRYLTITEVSPAGLLSHGEYALDKVNPAPTDDVRGGLSDYEQTIYDKLFASGDTVSTDTLANRFYTALPRVKELLYTDLVKRGFFSINPASVRNLYTGAGVVLVVCGAVVAATLAGLPVSPIYGWSLAACGAITLLFSKAMPRKTVLGRRTFMEARGFEEYLRTAEREQLQQDEKKQLFEAYLPYAISLGVASQWARAFSGIYMTPPDWYHGAYGASGFQPIFLTDSLSHACNSMGTAFGSAPRSASGGGSAFGGGGGFSGGGFGGGGGGSW